MIFEAKNISKTYDGKKVIDDFSLSVEAGDMIALVSRRGDGMTTLIQILTGMLSADEGTIEFEGTEVASKGKCMKLSKLRRKEIAYLSREASLMNNMTIYDNFMMALSFRKGSTNAKKKTCRDMIVDLGLKGKGRFLPRELSPLERQKVVLGRALIKRPKVVFCDEPTDILEGYDAEQFLALLQLINNNGEGPAFVVTTHSKRVASRFPKIVGIHKDIDLSQVQNASATIEGLSNTITGSSVVNAEKKRARREREAALLRDEEPVINRSFPQAEDIASVVPPKVSDGLEDYDLPELDFTGVLDDLPIRDDQLDGDDSLAEEAEANFLRGIEEITAPSEDSEEVPEENPEDDEI